MSTCPRIRIEGPSNVYHCARDEGHSGKHSFGVKRAGPKQPISDAAKAVHELLSSWGVTCNPQEWTEAVGIVQRAIDRSELAAIKDGPDPGALTGDERKAVEWLWGYYDVTNGDDMPEALESAARRLVGGAK